MRGDVLERHWIVDEVAAVEIDDTAGDAVAQIEIAIAQFDREILRDVIGRAGMQRPGEIGFRPVTSPAAAARDHVGVAKATERQIGEADAGADERRDAPPGAEIEIGVGEEQPFLLGDDVVVGVDDTAIVEGIERMELGATDIRR